MSRLLLFFLIIALFIRAESRYDTDHYHMRGSNLTDEVVHSDNRQIAANQGIVYSYKQTMRRLTGGDSGVAGKRVALLQVHFEGNVGDQMETVILGRSVV